MTKLIGLFVFIGLVACQTKSEKGYAGPGEVKYAKNFKIIQKKDYIELVIFNPKTHEPEAHYGLVHRGDHVSLPADLNKIEVPVQQIGAFSTTYVGMLSTLNETKSIKATTSADYIYNTELKRSIQAGKVLTSDFDGSINPTSLLKKDVSTIVYSGFGQPFPNQDKLEQLGITCIANYDWEEMHPLGKAEWIKFFGVLYEKSEEADRFFEEVKSNYYSVKNRVANTKFAKKKTILGGMVGDSWHTPAGKSFLAGIMKDAGLDYIYKNTDGTGSLDLSLSQVIRDEAECSRWINAEAKSMSELLRLNPKFTILNTVKTKQVYSYYNSLNYYWEYCSFRPDWLLEDFAMMSGALPEKKMHFYQRLK